MGTSTPTYHVVHAGGTIFGVYGSALLGEAEAYLANLPGGKLATVHGERPGIGRPFPIPEHVTIRS